MYRTFKKFVDLLPIDGTLIVCAEDTGAATLIPHARKAGRNIVSYGVQGKMTNDNSSWVQARELTPNARGGFDFTVSSSLSGNRPDTLNVSLQVPGEHNVRNALAVLTIVDVLGLSREEAARALAEFRGTGRRFQLRG